eukprot:PhF_6_TR33015/c0_g1_i1/m.48653
MAKSTRIIRLFFSSLCLLATITILVATGVRRRIEERPFGRVANDRRKWVGGGDGHVGGDSSGDSSSSDGHVVIHVEDDYAEPQETHHQTLSSSINATQLLPLPFVNVSGGLEEAIMSRTLRKCWGTTHPPKVYSTLLQETGCDVFTVPFNPTQDTACIAYLSNMDNWADLVPIKQRFDERTIKFKVKYKNPLLKAMLKVPQRLFPYEPAHEIGSFVSDRLMGINRVPPTVYIALPIDVIRNASKKGEKMVLVDEFAKESKVNNYSAWLRKDFFFVFGEKVENSVRHGAVIYDECESSVRHVFSCSIQSQKSNMVSMVFP